MSVVEVESPVFAELIDPDAELEFLGDGFQFTEGPVWNHRDGAMYFSDIPGDARWRWTRETGMELVAQPTFKGNGMAYELDGSLLVCEQVSSCLVRIRVDGTSRDRRLPLPGPVPQQPQRRRRAGARRQHLLHRSRLRPLERLDRLQARFVRDFKGVYRVPPGGGDVELVVAADEFEQPNGLCFSPDESLLYVNDSPRAEIKVYDVADDGSLSNCRMFREGIGRGTMEEGNLDGMECDEHGNIWTSGPGGVWVLDPSGERIGAIRTPEICGSVVFGGPDLRTLFLTTTTSVHLIETKVASAPLP